MTQRQHKEGTTEEQQEEKKGIISQLSMPAVLAAILTSVTSFLFSSKLGLAGSLIGAAIASAVSALASQLYNAMIRQSVEKLHDLSEQAHAKAEERQETAAMAPLTQLRTRVGASDSDELGAAGTAAGTGTPIAPEAYRREAARRRTNTLMRRTFVVAVLSALAALLVYAAIVHVATKGQGIGPTSVGVLSGSPQTTQEPRTQDGAAPVEGPTGPTQGDQDASGITPTPDEQGQDTTTGTGADTTTGADATTTDGTSTDVVTPVDEPPVEDPTVGGGETTTPEGGTTPEAGSPTP